MPEGGSERPIRTPRDAEGARRRERPVRCAVCRLIVTSPDAALEVQGGHAHLCTNPAGVRFRVVCYAPAPGCVAVGEPTAWHSWFPGTRWRFANCRGCGTHLGWRFDPAPDAPVAGSPPPFWGLIADHLER